MTQFLTNYLFDADFSINFSQLTLYLYQISIIFSSFSAGDRCPELPHLHNGRNIKVFLAQHNLPISKFSLTKVAASEGSAYHFKCNKGYKRYGMRNTHCDGQSWSHGDNTPVCTSRSNSFIPSQLLSSCLIARIALRVLF